MKFTPELDFPGGRLKPLVAEDIDALHHLYQHPEIPGQRPLNNKDQLTRMIDLSVQMAATQRGIMWSIEVDGRIVGMVSGFDWQASSLRIMLRVDGLPELELAQRSAALRAAMDFLISKYHVRNIGYQWISGQKTDIKDMLLENGFSHCATLRQAWRTAETEFADIEQYHFLSDQTKPEPKKLGDEVLGQRLDTQGEQGGASNS